MAIGVCTMKFVLAYIPTGLVIEYLLQLCVIGPQGWGEKGGEGMEGRGVLAYFKLQACTEASVQRTCT